MKYSELTGFYHELEATQSRLEMTDILVELIESVPKKSLAGVIHLTLGKLAPGYEGVEFGIAEKMVIKTLAFTTGFEESEVREIWHNVGDPGDAAEKLLGRKRQQSLFSTPLTFERVFSTLLKLAQTSGKGAQDVKMKYLSELLHDAEPLDSRYIVRTVVGKLRLGIADMTVIDALAIHYLKSLKKNSEDENEDDEEVEITVNEKKKVRNRIEAAYNIRPDIGFISETVVNYGMTGIDKVTIQPGIPIRVMLAERLTTPEDILIKMGGKAAFEYKYDGIRIQAHIRNGEKISLFTRQQENVSSQFPDVIEALDGISSDDTNIIVEGECVPVDLTTGKLLPFQMVSRRRGRKYDLKNAVEEFPVVLFLFDILYSNGNNLLNSPLKTRRKELEKVIRENDKIRLSNMKLITESGEVEKYFLTALNDGCEGLIAKSVSEDSYYRAGARGWQWIKLKRDYRSELVDTLDLVVVGGFYGKGRRAGTYGALLMAAYNKEKDRFETVCKLGSGFQDVFLEEMNSMFVSREMCSPRVESEIKADVWFEPEIVFEVLAAEITLSPIHTCGKGIEKNEAGIAVRFPRFAGRVRDEKTPEDSTSTEEMLELYRLQFRNKES